MLRLRFTVTAFVTTLILLTQMSVTHAGSTASQAKPTATATAPTVLIKTSAGEIEIGRAHV